MHEDLGTLLKKGYGTWTRNMIIAVPFILDLMATLLFALFAVFLFVMFFMAPAITSSTIANNVPPEVYLNILGSLLKENLLLFMAGTLVLLISFLLIESFFEAGAIGMCRLALLSGDTSVAQMWLSGFHNVVNLLLVKIMSGLIIMSGVLFLVPGALSAGGLGSLTTNPTSTGGILLGFGVLLWFIYALVAGILLFFAEYALVIDDLDPISALEKSLEFFRHNKAGVLAIIATIVAISLTLEMLGSAISSVEALADFWSLAYLFLSVLVIRPLTTIWITRMYLDRTEKELYSFDIYTFK